MKTIMIIIGVIIITPFLFMWLAAANSNRNVRKYHERHNKRNNIR